MSIRVLIVDDSSFVREVLKDLLKSADDIEVVGEACDGGEAQTMLAKTRPDVVTMDLLMPMVSGLEAAAQIMITHPTPIVVVADSSSPEALYRTALEIGAVEAVAKPAKGYNDQSQQELIAAIRRASHARPRRMPTAEPAGKQRLIGAARMRVLGVVASTGGPQTLARLLRALPASLRIPICLVQHTSRGFSSALVSWLSQECEMPVELAQEGALLRPGVVTVAPDDLHLQIRPGHLIHLSDAPALHSLRPSGDVLLRSLAKVYGDGSAALICTGMGKDGSDGLLEISNAGGLCLVQDPSTAVLPSMPKSAHEQVPSSRLVHLSRLADEMKRVLG